VVFSPQPDEIKSCRVGYLYRMKTSYKILIAYSLLVTGLLVTGFYYAAPCRHSAALFPTKMNVFYIGVDNTIEITACGVAPANLRPTISGGTMVSSGRPGHYIVRVSGGTSANINVGSNDSVYSNLGMYQFRVKRVPDPVAYVGYLKGDGVMSKAELGAVSGVFARMENFDFDIAFAIASFELSVLEDGKWVTFKANGPAVTPEMKKALAKVAGDDMVLFQNVIAKGPDGTLRKIPGVTVKVK
jgi:hypothetical protein